MDRNRCPNVEAMGCGELLRAVFDFSEQGVLPAPGGMSDQSAVFVEGMRIAQLERARIERDRYEKEESERTKEG